MESEKSMELNRAVDTYVRRKRLMGRRYVNNAKELNMFVRRNPHLALSDVTVDHVGKFLNEGKLQRQTWIGRYCRFRAFFAYWLANREISTVPMPPSRRVRKRFFAPYIYSRYEIRKILRAALHQHHLFSVVSPHSNRVFLTLLYATGVSTGEALALRIREVDIENARLTLSAKIGPPRTIPVGRDLQKILNAFVKPSASPDEYLFATKAGGPLLNRRVATVFRRIRRRAGVSRQDGSPYQPTMRDLRHTFAVHRIAEWYRQGVDVGVMLPKLAVYMGLFTLPLVERYLALVPAHFTPEVQRLSRTRWIAGPAPR
jgi:integrase/recombinase XerD